MSLSRGEQDERISQVRALMAQLSPALSAHWVESARQLLDNDEPNEALIQVAWGIATDRVELPVEALQFIEDSVCDRQDLPADLSGQSGPPVRRGPTPD
jgi:hypothetical protein